MYTNAIAVEHVSKSFAGHRAVRDLSLSVPRGGIFGLLGPNGAGKSTTIRMIMSIILPDSGTVTLFGGEKASRDLSTRIGYLPEERGLYRKMTVADQLVFLGELHGLKRADAGRRAAEWLEKLELASWSKKKVEELSKGMQQKIQLAGTMLHDPDIIILDEPFSGLDPINQTLFKDTFAEFKRLADRKKTVYDADIEAIVLGAASPEGEGWRIASMQVTSGTDAIPTASITLVGVDGRRVVEAANDGLPVLLADPHGKEQITRDLGRLVAKIAGQPEPNWDAKASTAARRSLWRPRWSG